MDRKDNYELDLGVECLRVHWGDKDPTFVTRLVEHLTAGFNKAMASLPKYKEYKAKTNNDCWLNGYWGDPLRTMTEQAIELGIPSI